MNEPLACFFLLWTGPFLLPFSQVPCGHWNKDLLIFASVQRVSWEAGFERESCISGGYKWEVTCKYFDIIAVSMKVQFGDTFLDHLSQVFSAWRSLRSVNRRESMKQ